jgi:hypothetical protein
MRTLFNAAFIAIVIGWIGVTCCMIRIAWLGRGLPNLPLHARMNPFNVMAMRSRWTPEISATDRIAVRFGLLFIVGILTSIVVGVLGPGLQ